MWRPISKVSGREEWDDTAEGLESDVQILAPLSLAVKRKNGHVTTAWNRCFLYVSFLSRIKRTIMITGKWVKSRARMLKTRSSITVKPAMGKIGGIYEASWETFREGDKFTALREVREACHQRHSCPGHIPSSSHPAQPGTSCIMKEGAEPKKSFPLYFSGLKYSNETNPFF